jgi:hypothetical protein
LASERKSKKRPKYKCNTGKHSVGPIQKQLHWKHHTQCGKYCRLKLEWWRDGVDFKRGSIGVKKLVTGELKPK